MDDTTQYAIQGLHLHFADFILRPVEFRHVAQHAPGAGTVLRKVWGRAGLAARWVKRRQAQAAVPPVTEKDTRRQLARAAGSEFSPTATCCTILPKTSGRP